MLTKPQAAGAPCPGPPSLPSPLPDPFVSACLGACAAGAPAAAVFGLACCCWAGCAGAVAVADTGGWRLCTGLRPLLMLGLPPPSMLLMLLLLPLLWSAPGTAAAPAAATLARATCIARASTALRSTMPAPTAADTKLATPLPMRALRTAVAVPRTTWGRRSGVEVARSSSRFSSLPVGRGCGW